MGFSIWMIRALLIVLVFVTSIVALFSGESELLERETTAMYPVAEIATQSTNAQIQPSQNQEQQSGDLLRLPLSSTLAALQNYRPKHEIAWAHPLNYGERFTKDINGMAVYNQPIVVIHETVNSAASAIHHFQTPHKNENDQASYHTLIKRDGTVVYIVPPEKRAFGAGNSVFDGSNGLEAVKTHPDFPASVNNFAYHTSLETPPDGRNNNYRHSGYTEAQYHSLAWLIAQSSVPDSRITTHKAVDRSGQKIDPRSFDTKKFFNLLHSYRQASINS